MEKIDFQKILSQIEEIRALFIFAQRVIPYLEELIWFIQETTPLLQEVNNSILDSSSKMPAAVAQLDRVSETTEMATSDILDGIERMLSRIEETLGLVDTLEQQEEEKLGIEKTLILKIAEVMDGEEATRAAQVEKALNEYYADHPRNQHLARLRENLLALQTDAYDIMSLLQVQDITTQQIMAANNLIESVQSRLIKLISRFGTLEPEPVQKKLRAFDPDATFEDRSGVQAMADTIFDQTEELTDMQVKEVSHEEAGPVAKEKPPQEQQQASQAEIDRLFQELKDG